MIRLQRFFYIRDLEIKEYQNMFVQAHEESNFGRHYDLSFWLQKVIKLLEVLLKPVEMQLEWCRILIKEENFFVCQSFTGQKTQNPALEAC